jgi:hypothetical protein
MSRTTIDYLVGGGAAVIGAGLFGALILVPTWGAYTRLWERLAAAVLSLYVLAVLVGVGVLAALAMVVYVWE